MDCLFFHSQILKLSYNKLKVVSPQTFKGLARVVRLHLDHNVIEFIEPFSFTGLTVLRLLQLEGNRLRDLHPHTFVTLSFLGRFWGSSLRHLYLSDNQLQFLLPGALQPLGDLEVLHLHGNPWTCDCQLQWLVEWNKKAEGTTGNLEEGRGNVSLNHNPIPVPKLAKSRIKHQKISVQFTCFS